MGFLRNLDALLQMDRESASNRKNKEEEVGFLAEAFSTETWVVHTKLSRNRRKWKVGAKTKKSVVRRTLRQGVNGNFQKQRLSGSSHYPVKAATYDSMI